MTAATKTPAAVLREARALIEDKKHWTYDSVARNKYGKPVETNSPAAVRWCATGALRRAGHSTAQAFNQAFTLLEGASVRLFQTQHVTLVNDDKGHAAVMAMYAEAIRLAEAAEVEAGS